MLDDFIAKEKDDEYKLKHIKEFYSFNMTNESGSWILLAGALFFLYKFIESFIEKKLTLDEIIKIRLKNLAKMLNRRLKNNEKVIFSENIVYYIFKIGNIILKINKNDNYIYWFFEDESLDDKEEYRVYLTQEEINTLIKKLKI